MANQSTRPTKTDNEDLLDLLWPGGTSSLAPQDFVALVAAISQATGTDLQALVDMAMRPVLLPSQAHSQVAV